MSYLYCLVCCLLNGKLPRLEKRELIVNHRLLVIQLFLFEGVTRFLAAWEMLRYFMVALPGPSI